MRIAVLITEVAVVRDDFEITDDSIAERHLEYDLNEWDDYAVEEAVQAEEEGLAEEVVAVTVGPERAEETIREALAKGVDRAVRVWDDALDGIDLLSVGTKAELLAAVLEREKPDLVLAGVQAGDDAFGATGVAVADALGYQWAAVVNQLDVDADADVATVHRELEGGVEEVTEVDLPAVFTVQSGINEPRYASLRGIRGAQDKELEAVTLDDIGVPAAAVDGGVTLASMYEPEAETDVTYLEGGVDEQAADLAALLRERGVVET